MHDWRLGVFHRLCQLGVIAYVVFGVVTKKMYMMKAAPIGVVRTQLKRAQVEYLRPASGYAYCEGSVISTAMAAEKPNFSKTRWAKQYIASSGQGS